RVSPYFFLFQAEDGIRAFHVTGVQTCALPISCGRVELAAAGPPCGRRRPTARLSDRPSACGCRAILLAARRRSGAGDARSRLRQIGRASWRESAQLSEEATDYKLMEAASTAHC